MIRDFVRMGAIVIAMNGAAHAAVACPVRHDAAVAPVGLVVETGGPVRSSNSTEG